MISLWKCFRRINGGLLYSGMGQMTCDDEHTEASTLSSIAFLARVIASLGP